jgi:hypothetical protein
MKKILHLMPDDKFIDWAITLFETCAPNMNEYFIYNRNSKQNTIYVKSLDRIRFAPVGSAEYEIIINNCRSQKYAAVVIHSLPDKFYKLVSDINGCVQIAVMTWGHEIYYYINGQEYLPLTKNILRSRDLLGRFGLLKATKRKCGQFLKTNFIRPLDPNLKKLLTVNYICPVIDVDYNRFSSKFNRFQMPEMLDFSYADIEMLTSGFMGYIDGDNVLLGNSATPTGNHLDMFHIIKKLGITNQILTPLNYGDSAYADIIRTNGKKYIVQSI